MDETPMLNNEPTWRQHRLSYFLLLQCALWNLYIVYSPTNALFIKLGKV